MIDVIGIFPYISSIVRIVRKGLLSERSILPAFRRPEGPGGPPMDPPEGLPVAVERF